MECMRNKQARGLMKKDRFEELNCWQEAVTLVSDVYQLTALKEFSKDFSLREQMRRAAVSISSNIAEGKERDTKAEFIRFLFIAKGSAGELRSLFHICNIIGYLDESAFRIYTDRTAKVSGMIGNLIKSLKGKK